MVMYLTGICTEDCFYCPLSEEKKGKDVIFANERRIDVEDPIPGLIGEARRMKALGTGITGGDPIVRMDRLVTVIKALRSEFGKGHHIHMYTSSAFDPRKAGLLFDAGLNEIRFHPPLGTWKDFSEMPEKGSNPAMAFHRTIASCIAVGLKTGIEVPAMPDPGGKGWEEGLLALVDYAIRTRLDFVNMNELEASHTNNAAFIDLGYDLVEDSMAVVGSRELASRVISTMAERYPGHRTVLHLCSSTYKDAIQLRNRLKRTAANVRRPYEIVTEDGTLLRGVIVSADPAMMAKRLAGDMEVPDEMMEVSQAGLLIAPWILERIARYIEEEAYLSEVYPTADGLEVERVPL